MATGNIVCGSCGAPLSRTDNFCPRCGSRLFWADEQDAGTRLCDVCGHPNVARAETCESCGAKLSGKAQARGVELQGPAPKERRQGRQKEQRQNQSPRTPGKFEPWQIISFVALLALVVFLIYNEMSKPPSKTPGGSIDGAPSQAPVSKTLVDLEPLERAVDATPNDPDALLRFANALYDNGAYLRAVEVYKKYLVLRPKNANARVDLGICYYELSSLDTSNTVHYLMIAMNEMQRAHVDSVTHQPAVFNLGVVNLRLGNLEESNKWFREAVRLNRTSDLGVRAQRMLEQHTLPQQ